MYRGGGRDGDEGTTLAAFGEVPGAGPKGEEGAVEVVAITRRQSSVTSSQTAPVECAMPALAKQESTRPNSSTARATMASTWVSSATSLAEFQDPTVGKSRPEPISRRLGLDGVPAGDGDVGAGAQQADGQPMADPGGPARHQRHMPLQRRSLSRMPLKASSLRSATTFLCSKGLLDQGRCRAGARKAPPTASLSSGPPSHGPSFAIHGNGIWHRLGVAHDVVAQVDLPVDWRLGHGDVPHTCEERVEHCLHLQASEVGSEAEVWAPSPESKVWVRAATDVKSKRFVEGALVPIGRYQPGGDAVALSDPLARELDVGLGASAPEGDRRCPSDDLFDGRGQQGWVLACTVEFGGVFEKRPQPPRQARCGSYRCRRLRE